MNKLQYWCQTTRFCGSERHYQGEGLKFKFLAILYGCRKLFSTLYDAQEKRGMEDELRSLSAWRRHHSLFWFCRRHFGIFNQAAAVWIGFQVWNKWKNAALSYTGIMSTFLFSHLHQLMTLRRQFFSLLTCGFLWLRYCVLDLWKPNCWLSDPLNLGTSSACSYMVMLSDWTMLVSFLGLYLLSFGTKCHYQLFLVSCVLQLVPNTTQCNWNKSRLQMNYMLN